MIKTIMHNTNHININTFYTLINDIFNYYNFFKLTFISILCAIRNLTFGSICPVAFYYYYHYCLYFDRYFRLSQQELC